MSAFPAASALVEAPSSAASDSAMAASRNLDLLPAKASAQRHYVADVTLCVGQHADVLDR
jgi:hypothetical protein